MIFSFIITSSQKNFMREYHVPSDFSLYDLRRFIESDLDFDDSQQGVFFLLDKKGKKVESYSLFDMGNGSMDTVVLEDLSSKKNFRLLYTFDFFNDRSLYMDFQGEAEPIPRKHYPIVAAAKGDAPGQFSENAVEDELPEVPDSGDDYNDEDLSDLEETDRL